MKVLLVHPGASWSTADVEAGLRYGLELHGVQVVRYRLDVRIARAQQFLFISYRKRLKEVASEAAANGDDVAAAKASVVRPNAADMVLEASKGVLFTALKHQVDAVLVVSGMVLHPDAVIVMKRAGLRVVVLFTESPYDEVPELRMAGLVDGGWTNERASVERFLTVNTNVGYLPHAWHPERHRVEPSDMDVRSHDVVFVGSGFPERIKWFNAIDWTGIDLGLYGTWDEQGLKPDLQRCIHGEEVDNRKTAQLYRRAKVGLNMYRTSQGWGGKGARKLTLKPESLSPRAYELAACGAFHLSQPRAEVAEIFGELVPTFRSPAEASDLIRLWLADPEGRARVAAQLPACVAEASWAQRARTVIGDLQVLLARPRAA